MRSKKYSLSVLLMIMILICNISQLWAADKPEINAGFDLVSRYVWRGLEFGYAPSLQPTLAVSCFGFELGTWGAYTLSNGSTDSDEIDFWFGYTYEFENAISVGVILTDYYFPGTGVDFFNFNDYDDPEGAGAHTLELGFSVCGPESFPISLAGYINVYNEEGNNIYFQADYPLSVPGADLNFFIGATPGSEDNPDYYGSDNFAVINIGVTASKEIEISDKFSLPVFVSYILNPGSEISYLVAGMSF